MYYLLGGQLSIVGIFSSATSLKLLSLLMMLGNANKQYRQVMRKKSSGGESRGRKNSSKNNSPHKRDHKFAQKFHLDEHPETTLAKNALLLEADSPKYVKKAMNKTCHNSASNTYFQSWQSWHDNQQPYFKLEKPAKFINNLMRTEGHPIKQDKAVLMDQRRYLLKSAMELRETRKNLQELKGAVKNDRNRPCSFLHSKVLTLNPNERTPPSRDCSTQKSRRHIKSAYSSLRVSEQMTNSISQSKEKQPRMMMSSPHAQEKSKLKAKSEVIAPLQMEKTKKGMMGSLIRGRNSKKGKWINMKNKITNISRVYEVENPTLKSDIGRILNLIKEENMLDKDYCAF